MPVTRYWHRGFTSISTPTLPTGVRPIQPGVGVGGDKGRDERLPGSGGTRAPRPRAKIATIGPRTRRRQEAEKHTGGEAGHRYAEGPAAGEPPGVDRDLNAGRWQQQGG